LDFSFLLSSSLEESGLDFLSNSAHRFPFAFRRASGLVPVSVCIDLVLGFCTREHFVISAGSVHAVPLSFPSWSSPLVFSSHSGLRFSRCSYPAPLVFLSFEVRPACVFLTGPLSVQLPVSPFSLSALATPELCVDCSTGALG
jgi:hypothetical protein